MPDRSRQETGHVGNADGSVFVHPFGFTTKIPTRGALFTTRAI